MIRVLIVEDSKLMALQIEEVLREHGDIEVVGRAANGRDAVELNQRLKPSVVTMDIHMPEMDGLEATRQMMAHRPVPILIVSNSTFREGMGKVFEALSSGALDIYDKTRLENLLDNAPAKQEFIEKVRLLAGTPVIRHPLAKMTAPKMPVKAQTGLKTTGRVVAIGASTGGPQALMEVLPKIPADFPYPVLLVQHIVASFTEGFADWLGTITKLKVKVAEAGELLKAGVLYVAPASVHMAAAPGGGIELRKGAPVDGQIPSATVLLESVAAVYGPNALGIILTGMGQDGAKGLKAMKDAGAETIAQDESTSIIYGMPKAAAESGAARAILPLPAIDDYILTWARR